MNGVDDLQSVRESLLAIIEREGAVVLGQVAQVHRTIDMLRVERADPAMLLRMETISCILWSLPLFRRQGRVNAHASALLRLRRAASAL